MFKKTMLMALCLTASLTTLSWADGGFWGYITYDHCTCSGEDQVCIRPMSGGNCTLWDVHCEGQDAYGTGSTTYPPGSYYLSVVIHNGSDCDYSYVQGVNHGSTLQQVNLYVSGPDGGGSRAPQGP